MGKDLKGKELGKGFGQRKDGRYEARAVINGEKINLYDFNLNELKIRFEQEKENIKRKNNPLINISTVGEWFDIWFETYKIPTLKSTGVSIYKRKYVNTYGKYLKDIKLQDLIQFTIQNTTNELINEGVSCRYVRDGLSALKSMLDAAIGSGLITKNPALGVIVPTYGEVKEDRRVLSKTEQQIFIDCVKNDFYNEMYLFMLSTGVRIGELGALQWKDIDFKNEFIKIQNSLSIQYENGKKTIRIVEPKTRNSVRLIPFFGETKEILIKQKEKQDALKKQLGKKWRKTPGYENVDFVFTTTKGSPITRYSAKERLDVISTEINNRLLIQANRNNTEVSGFENIHPHSLRHTFATRCLEKGMNIETLQRIMGHANINMTLSYAHILEDTLKNEALKMGNFLDA